MRGSGVKLLLQGMEDVGDVLDVHDIAMGVENLDKTAHVSALEFLGQIDKHPNRGYRVLHSARLVADLDGEMEAAHAYLIDPQFAVVAFTLLVVQFGLGRPALAGGPRRAIPTWL